MIALAAVAVLLAAGLVAVVVSRDEPPPVPESPLTAVVDYDDIGCGAGWIVPDEGQRSVERVGFVPPPGSVRASGVELAVTVQGTSGVAVVIESVDVEVVRRVPPPEELFLRVSCQGEVEPRLFQLDLDRPQPALAPEQGTRGFPYRVDHAEPELLIVTPLVTEADVEWRLRMKWTSMGRSGELVLDDGGRPFRTAATSGSRELCQDGRLVWRPVC